MNSAGKIQKIASRLIAWRKLIVAACLSAGALLSASAVFAQGCALCYSDAAATPPQAQAALRHGILTLLFPPMFIFGSLFAMLYVRRNDDRESAVADEAAREELATQSAHSDER